MTDDEALGFVKKHGVVLESASGPVPTLADIVLGERHGPGSWWGHPRGRELFRLTRLLRARDDVLVCRLVAGKVTYVHRRVWPALARLSNTIAPKRLEVIREEHTKTGAHRVRSTPFRRWVQPEVLAAGAALTDAEARAQLGDWVSGLRSTSRRRAT